MISINDSKSKVLLVSHTSKNSLLIEDNETGARQNNNQIANKHEIISFKDLNSRAPVSSLFRPETSSDSKLDQPWTWNEEQRKIELLATRLEDCQYMDWASLQCLKCERTIKKNVVRLSCLSPFCKNNHCIENKIRVARNYLKSFKIYRENLIHIIFGFPVVKSFTKEINKHHHRVISAFTLQMKKLGTPLKMIKVRDVSKSKNGLFVHYHCAQLPVKDVRKFLQNIGIARLKVMENPTMSFTCRFKHYRKKEALFNYFANRMAGVFGDIKAGRSYGYQDLMDLKEYRQTFYNTKALSRIGLKHVVRSTNVPLLLDNKIQTCPFCECDKLILKPNFIIDKPPDEHCSKCGQDYYPEDFLPNVNSCKACNLTNSFSHRKAEELKHKLPAVSEMYRKSADEEIKLFIAKELQDQTKQPRNYFPESKEPGVSLELIQGGGSFN